MTTDFENEPMEDFERELAAFEPHVLRPVTLQTASRDIATKRSIPDWMRYAVVGLSCFALGAGAMYATLDVLPQRRETPPPPPPGYVALPMFGDAEIARMRRPIDAMRLMTPEPRPAPQTPETGPSLYTMQQEMMKNE